jgi:hypothetical protein
MAATLDPVWQPKPLIKSIQMAEPEWTRVGGEQSLDPRGGCQRQEMVEPN